MDNAEVRASLKDAAMVILKVLDQYSEDDRESILNVVSVKYCTVTGAEAGSCFCSACSPDYNSHIE